jgi:hypothetical protein
MNERIEELKQQAMIEVRSHGAFGESERYRELDVDKFAELIINECADLAYAGEEYNKMGGYDRGWQRGRNDAVKKIKEHFGVE